MADRLRVTVPGWRSVFEFCCGNYAQFPGIAQKSAQPEWQKRLAMYTCQLVRSCRHIGSTHYCTFRHIDLGIICK